MTYYLVELLLLSFLYKIISYLTTSALSLMNLKGFHIKHSSNQILYAVISLYFEHSVYTSLKTITGE